MPQNASSTDWTVLVVQTKTGAILDEVPEIGDPQYARKINDTGSWSITVPYSQLSLKRRAALTNYLTPWKYSWVILFRGVAIQGGPVVHYQWQDQSSSMSVSGIGMGGMLLHRLAREIGPEGTNIVDTSSDIMFTNVSLIQECKSLIQKAVYGTNNELPFLLPPDDTTGASSDTYFGYEMATTAERINTISKKTSGPDIDFNPVVWGPTGGYIAWDVRIGAPLGTFNPNAVWDYPYGALSIDTDVDGSHMASRVWVVGSGNQRQLLAGYVTNPYQPSLGFPNLDAVNRDHTDQKDVFRVLDFAAAHAKQLQLPISTWTVSTRLDITSKDGRIIETPQIGQYLPGDTIRINVFGHQLIPDGEYIQRLLGFQNGSRAGDVQLLLQSTSGFF